MSVAVAPDLILRKKLRGSYFTVGNPFAHPAFLDWAINANVRKNTILEPFAGKNSLIDHLAGMDLCTSFKSFDIEPANSNVEQRDTLASFPTGFDVCITNPPWLARNIATFKGLPFPEGTHSNLYQYALERCLDHCAWLAALIPESFIRSGKFRERLTDFISVTECLFTDTGHPVGLALFGADVTKDVVAWSGLNKVGLLSEIEHMYPHPKTYGYQITFNDPDGNVGLIALDNTIKPSIRFCEVKELSHYVVKQTGRHITKVSVEGDVRLNAWNEALYTLRERTSDLLMTCYKGIRKDGMYRRRLDWKLARGIIHNA